MKVLLTGGTGLVGHALVSLLPSAWSVYAPSRSELNLLDPRQIEQVVTDYQPTHIVHAAAYVDATAAEKQRGDRGGICWRVNVDATKFIVEAAEDIGARVLYISTGSVFHGTKENSGPFSEKDRPHSTLEDQGWYAYTKFQGELHIDDTIIRISHPVVPKHLQVKADYTLKLLELYKSVGLYPLFIDQYFPLTYVPDLAVVIEAIIAKAERGVFHVASRDVTTPYDLFMFVRRLLNISETRVIERIPIEVFYAQGNSRARFAQYSALDSRETAQRLHTPFTGWQQAVIRAYAP